MPALVLIGYWALFTGLIFIALQYLPRKPRQLCCGVAGPVVTAMVAACWQQTHPAAVIHLVSTISGQGPAETGNRLNIAYAPCGLQY
jgi:hypothetical protein